MPLLVNLEARGHGKAGGVYGSFYCSIGINQGHRPPFAPVPSSLTVFLVAVAAAGTLGSVQLLEVAGRRSRMETFLSVSATTAMLLSVSFAVSTVLVVRLPSAVEEVTASLPPVMAMVS